MAKVTKGESILKWCGKMTQKKQNKKTNVFVNSTLKLYLTGSRKNISLKVCHFCPQAAPNRTAKIAV